jgi:hypothetical protein
MKKKHLVNLSIISLAPVILYTITFFWFETNDIDLIPVDNKTVLVITQEWDRFSQWHPGKSRIKYAIAKLSIKEGYSWKVYINGMHRTLSSVQMGFYPDHNTYYTLSSKIFSYTYDNTHIGLDLDTGTILWKNTSDPHNNIYENCGLHEQAIFSDEQAIYQFYRSYHGVFLGLKKLDQATGKTILEKKYPAVKFLIAMPLVTDSHIICHTQNEHGSQLLFIDKKTLKSSIINDVNRQSAQWHDSVVCQQFFATGLWPADPQADKRYKDEGIYEDVFNKGLRSRILSIPLSTKKKNILRNHYCNQKDNLPERFTICGIYKNRIITYDSHQFHAYTLPDLKSAWAFSYSKDYDNYTMTPDYGKTYQMHKLEIKNRYFPLVFYVRFKGLRQTRQLTILDLETGKSVFSSQAVNFFDIDHYDFLPNIYYDDPYFYIITPLMGFENSALLQYNPSNNTFGASFQIVLHDKKARDTIYPPDFYAKAIKDQTMYFSIRNEVYAVDLNTLEFIYGQNKNLEIKNTREAVLENLKNGLENNSIANYKELLANSGLGIFGNISQILSEGNKAATELVLENKNYIHMLNGFDETLLMSALAYGNETAAHLLLDNGIDPFHVNAYGDTALTYAVKSQIISVVKRLLEKGVDPNLKNNLGMTALNYAVQGENGEIVKLLKNGADQNTTDNKKR